MTTTISNDYIADQFSLLSKLMDIHGENSFKTKTYSVAAFTLEKLPQPVRDLPLEKITAIKGIGDATGKKIMEILETGQLRLLNEYIHKTPTGVIDMLRIKGLGPKKIATIWKEIELESIGELLYACQENRLLLYKGFGEKTQNNVREAIEFMLRNSDHHLYAELETYAQTLQQRLHEAFPTAQLSIAGDFRRQLETIDRLLFVTTADAAATTTFLEKEGFTPHADAPSPANNTIQRGGNTPTHGVTNPTIHSNNTPQPGGVNTQTETTQPGGINTQTTQPGGASTQTTITYKSTEGILIHMLHTTADNFTRTLFDNSCSGEFLEAWREKVPHSTTSYPTEDALFAAAGIAYIPPFLREQRSILEKAAAAASPNTSRPTTQSNSPGLNPPSPTTKSNTPSPNTSGTSTNHPFSNLIQTSDIRSIIHSHSTWSDGSNTLEEMATACIQQGFEYLVISDHSKSAFYANGLKEDRIREQHAQIDELNKKLAPFTIFKSIECDILNDGTLDYSDDILATFDLVITSIHSNLKMSEEKAMSRLLKALDNPYTTILGHMTGRLLLSRPGYPVDHRTVIDTCVRNHVAIELNAHPRRLDIDWRWISYALDQGALISIDPDAHSINGYKDIRFGTLAAQKAGLTPAQNLSSFNLQQFKNYLAERKKTRGL